MSEETVLKLLKVMDENKTAGLDNLSGKFLKGRAIVLAEPVSQICNLFMKYSIFPSDCKIVKSKPLFKKGLKTATKNYRPISILSLVSKIIERGIHDETQSFIDKNNIIYRYSQVSANFPRDLCLSYLNNKIATGFESGLYIDMILVDLQKAFDTI